MNTTTRSKVLSLYRIRRNDFIPKLPTLSKHFQSTISASKELETPTDIEEYLSKPSWSLKDLLSSPPNPKQSQVSREKLHHLLRLSALPLPASDVEESQMIKDLESQLHFVQAIQKIDTNGVEPLQRIRDETEEVRKASTIEVTDLQEYLDKEVVTGKRGRIRNKEDGRPGKPALDGHGLLSQAPKRLGRYVVVDTVKD